MQIDKIAVGRALSVAGIIGFFAALILLILKGPAPGSGIALIVAVAGLGGWVVLSPEDARAMLRGRQLRYGGFAVLSTALFIGALVVLYVLATTREVAADLTQTQKYTVSGASKQALADLKTPIHIVGFFTGQSIQAQENTTVLLRQYEQATDGLITFEFIDPDQNPTTATAYGVQSDRELFARRRSDPPEEAEFVAFIDEREITRAILKLVRAGDFHVYFTTGHGEYSIDETGANGLFTARRILDDYLNVGVDAFNLLTGAVPKDADALVICGAQSPFTPEETERLIDYLAQGGRLLLAADPPLPLDEAHFLDSDDPFAAHFWETYGVRFRDDIVVPTVYLPNEPLSAVAGGVQNHPVTDGLAERLPIFSVVRTLERVPDPEDRPAGVIVAEIVQSNPDDYAEADFEALRDDPTNFGYNEGVDTEGPLTLAMAVQNRVGEETEARLVLVGDSEFMINDLVTFPGNTLFLANSIDWLIEYSAEIEVEVVSNTSLIPPNPTSEDMTRIQLLTILVMPGTVLAVGLVVWWSRRQR